MEITLTEKQRQGLEIAVERFKKREPWTCIAGYAGTGKSTLIEFIIAALGLNKKDDVAYITFTGKAANVLAHKNCPNAMTAHKFLYYSKKDKSGKFVFVPKSSVGNYRLVVVDEISMLPKKLWDLLLTHHIHVIALGDPFQLPPIDKEGANDVLDNPHIFLDQVMRQAEDSEIIKLSMNIRNGEPLPYYTGQQLQILPHDKFVDGMLDWADQVICAKNATRFALNNQMREMRGYTDPLPQIGDKIICDHNHWQIEAYNADVALTNGAIGYVQACYTDNITYPIWNFKRNPVPIIMVDFTTQDNEEFGYLRLDQQMFQKGRPYLTPQEEYYITNNPRTKGDEPLVFEYGYAITCHKAQGGEWNKVLVIEENFPFDKEEHARWLYTAITRAQDKCVLIRP